MCSFLLPMEKEEIKKTYAKHTLMKHIFFHKYHGCDYHSDYRN